MLRLNDAEIAFVDELADLSGWGASEIVRLFIRLGAARRLKL
jgi:hypothetical protein